MRMDVMATTKERRRVPIAEGNARRTWTLPEELLARLEAWRGAQRPIPTESQAAAKLLKQALDAVDQTEKKAAEKS